MAERKMPQHEQWTEEEREKNIFFQIKDQKLLLNKKRA